MKNVKKKIEIKKLRRYEIRVIQYNDDTFSISLKLFGIKVTADTLAEAFIKFGDKLKRVKKRKYEKIWSC